MQYLIKIERGGEFVPWEVIDLPNGAAANDRCQALSVKYEAAFSAEPAANTPMAAMTVKRTRAVMVRYPIAVTAITAAIASGPAWWMIFHFL